MDALVRKHLPMVRRIAWHVHGSMSTIVDVEDLVQIGLVALVEAAGGFEDRGQVTFEQYLVTRLRGSMIDELRRQATLTRGAMRRRRAYNDAVASLTDAIGAAPTDLRSPNGWASRRRSCAPNMRPPKPCGSRSIDDVYTDEGPWFASDEPSPFDQLADADQRDALIAAIAELPEREAAGDPALLRRGTEPRGDRPGARASARRASARSRSRRTTG